MSTRWDQNRARKKGQLVDDARPAAKTTVARCPTCGHKARIATEEAEGWLERHQRKAHPVESQGSLL